MTIRHSTGAYDVLSGTLENALRQLPPDCRIITDRHVWEVFGRLAPSELPVLSVEPGEGAKSLETYSECLRWLADSGASRSTHVVALGGGVVGDLGGFAAATYMRGVPYIQIPTTLLAQVDSSVGGKVGIDLPEGKNLVGAFYPPSKVHICHDALRTLPERQVRNGLSEVLKYGFIMEPTLLEWTAHEGPTLQNPLLERIVLRCIELKARVVEEDERETTGVRAVLNFGHTVGHAIEHITGYGPVLHGEAIAIGMVVEARLGETLGITQRGTADRVQTVLEESGLATTHHALRSPDLLIHAMYRDKKAHAGRLAFSLLTKLGECKLVSNVDEEVVRTALDAA